MLTINAKKGIETYMVSFRRGDLIIEELEKFLKKEGIDAALITSGIGSLDICNMHTITSTDLPPVDKQISLKGPVEVGNRFGCRWPPHIHVVVHDVKNDKVYVGHLEPGSRCCYRVEIGLTVLKGIKTKRLSDEKTGLIDIVEA